MGNITKSLQTNIRHATTTPPIATDLIPFVHAADVDLVTPIKNCTVAQLAAAAAAALLVDSNVYTPIASALVNLDAAVPTLARWQRIGNVIYVAGQISLDPTLAVPTPYSVRLTLPVVTVFAGTTDGAGSGCSGSIDPGFIITSVTGTALVQLDGTAVTLVAATNFGFNFAYQVIIP